MTKPIEDAEFIVGFRAFAASKPEGELYNYVSNSNCAVAQFLREAHGYDNPSVIPGHYRFHQDGEQFEFPDGIEFAAGGHTNETYMSWGSVVERLNGALPA